ncbi:MAG: type II toxin-antitoxin system HicB family antitoxin [Candidatus Adiutrix sp.]|jgi:predicted HicB family RNase H-like nuclease|nr:type II toxin-antitoxin system HicB family antitoxin [Candidatus Adiutrix sp.]
MMNVMEFDDGYKATIAYDPEIEMFRGEFFGLNGGADFYAKDPASLRHEGEISLRVFLEACAEKDIPPRKPGGKFALRLDPELYAQAGLAAKAQGLSLNQWITQVVSAAANY